jgi:hypothetical protein
MNYKLQKILLADCTVYNILFENKILGHVIVKNDNMTLIQTDDLNIVALAESFGFSGNGYHLVVLEETKELKPIYEYKVINLQDQFLTEEVI